MKTDELRGLMNYLQTKILLIDSSLNQFYIPKDIIDALDASESLSPFSRHMLYMVS